MNVLLILLAAILAINSACGPGQTASKEEIAKYVNLSPYSSNQEERAACSASDLSCNFDSDEKCSWHNEDNNDLPWQRAELKRTLNKNQIRTITKRTELPNGDLLAAGSQNGVDLSRESNLVARLTCQRGNGKLQFDRWMSSDSTDFEVCTRSVGSGLVHNCARVLRAGENPFSYNVPESDSPFDILLTVKSFTEPAFVAVDNVNYSGDLCQCEDDANYNAESCLSLLNCDFEDQFCHYNNTGRGSRKGVWNRNKGNVGNPALGVRHAPSGYYANVGDSVPDQAASISSDLSTVYVLESPKFTLKQPARLSFDLFQKAVGPKLEVCTGQGNCQLQKTGVTDEWVRHTVELSPGIQTITFVAKDVKINDFIALDNINVEGGSNEGCTRISK